MHELQFMTNLVRMVEEVCQKQPSIRPSVIRIQVSSHSHLADHTVEELQTMFKFVTRGGLAQDAKLEIISKTVTAECHACGARVECHSETFACPCCGSGNLEREESPEVLLKEIEYAERNN